MSLSVTDGRGPRIAAIDALRGIAIAAMIVYHFSWDLSSFGFFAVDVINDPGWKAFARTIAGTFVGLVGVSLVLATRKGLQLRPFLRRLAMIVGAALLVTLGTWLWFPNAFVFFGILHLIAFASVAALLFLPLPTPIVFIAACAIFLLPFFFSDPVFDHPLLWWIGLTPRPPNTVDYVPVLPWFGVALFGIVAGRLLLRYASDSAFARWKPTGPIGRLAVFAGRWSLIIYLVHQPLLIGILTLVAPFATPDVRAQAATFRNECVTTCRSGGRQPPVCDAYCGCVLNGLTDSGLLSTAMAGRMNAEEKNLWLTMVDECRPLADAPTPGAGLPPAD